MGARVWVRGCGCEVCGWEVPAASRQRSIRAPAGRPALGHAIRHENRNRGARGPRHPQKLNVTAFLAGAVAGGVSEVVGAPYEDGSSNTYLPMFRQPVPVYAGDAAALAGVHGRALSRGPHIAVSVEAMSRTGNDTEDRAPSARSPSGSFPWWGRRCTARRTRWTGRSRVCPRAADPACRRATRAVLRRAARPHAGSENSQCVSPVP